jgi:hypothetical protein
MVDEFIFGSGRWEKPVVLPGDLDLKKAANGI